MCAQGLMTPLSGGEPAHYISTLPFLGKDPQDASPFFKKDIERFLWNFLASRTAAGPANTGSCDGPGLFAGEFKQISFAATQN